MRKPHRRASFLVRSGLVAGLAAMGLAVVPAGATTPAYSTWPTLGGGPARTFDASGAPETSAITPATASQLVAKWRYPTVEPVTASPAVATVPYGTGSLKVVYDGAGDAMFYAIDAATGLPLWTQCLVAAPPVPGSVGAEPVPQVPVPWPVQLPGSSSPTGGTQSLPACDPAYPTNPEAQTDYASIVASPAVASVGGTQEVFEASNATVWAMNAATGAVSWAFNAAGPLDNNAAADPYYKASYANNYEIEASPLVVTDASGEQLVIFSIDCNGYCAKPGGVYAVDAATGHLAWFFDPANGTAYAVSNGSLPSGTTAFAPWDDQAEGGPASAGTGACGGIWASQSADVSLGLLFTASADCPQYPTTSPYYEAVFALQIATGTPAWTWQPRTQGDASDLDFGATPNVFTLATGEHVVGEGSKDGSYRLFDAQSGNLLWADGLTGGGNFGGFYNGATDGTNIYLDASIGAASGSNMNPNTGSQNTFAVNAATGAVVWDSVLASPSFGQDLVVGNTATENCAKASLLPGGVASAFPAGGVYFVSGLDTAIHAYDTCNGQQVAAIPTAGADSSGPVASGDELFSGTGTGSTFRAAVGTCLDPTGLTCASIPPAPVPIPIAEDADGIWGFCLASDPTCQSGRVTDGLLAPPGPADALLAPLGALLTTPGL
ncbi:MAG: outer membrane protein assembly factor BamB family protein [Acidimicrobiales bacterium]